MDREEKIKELLDKLKEKDDEDYNHSLRVREAVKKLVKKFDVSPEEKEDIITAGLLHDIGILEIPDNILKKAGRLGFDEYEEIKHHSEEAEKLLKDMDNMKNIIKIIRHHHENFNGFGYPDGLEGENIPLGSRILHVIEAYDSMVNPRKGRKTEYSKEMALKELSDFKERIYDAKVVDKFIEIKDEL